MAKKYADGKLSDLNSVFAVTDQLESILKSVQDELPDISDDDSSAEEEAEVVTVFKRKLFLPPLENGGISANGEENEASQSEEQSRGKARSVSRQAPILKTAHEVNETQLDAALNILKRRNEAGLERPVNQSVVSLVDSIMRPGGSNGSRQASSAAHADVVHRLAMMANEFMPQGGGVLDLASLDLHSGKAALLQPPTRDAAVQCRERSYIPARSSRKYAEMSMSQPERLGNRCSMGTCTEPLPVFPFDSAETQTVSQADCQTDAPCFAVSTGTSTASAADRNRNVRSAPSAEQQAETIDLKQPRTRGWEFYISQNGADVQKEDSDSGGE